MVQLQQSNNNQGTSPQEKVDIERQQQERLTAFKEEVKKYIPKENTPATQDQLLGIFQAAYSKLAETEAPKQGAITLAKLNAELSKHGFALALAITNESKLDDLTLIRFDPQKTTKFDGGRFKSLIGLTNYPDIEIVQGERISIYGNHQNSVTPGQTFIRENQKALVLTYPEEIKKQTDIFKKQGVNIDASTFTDMIRINEASHSLLDALLKGREVNVEALRIPIKGEIAVKVAALDTKQFHEIWSDAATLKLTNDLSGAMSILGRQSDPDHAATFQLLHNSTFVALHLWATEGANEDDQRARKIFSASIIKNQANGGISIDFDKLSSKMKSDPILRDKISEVVGGVYQSLASGVLRATLEQGDDKK